jgi:hypothetical protein
MDCPIRLGLGSGIEARIIGEKFDLKNVKPVKLRKEIGSGVRDMRKRVALPLRFARKKRLMSTGKIEVVHLAITRVHVAGDGNRRNSKDCENQETLRGEALHAGNLPVFDANLKLSGAANSSTRLP